MELSVTVDNQGLRPAENRLHPSIPHNNQLNTRAHPRTHCVLELHLLLGFTYQLQLKASMAYKEQHKEGKEPSKVLGRAHKGLLPLQGRHKEHMAVSELMVPKEVPTAPPKALRDNLLSTAAAQEEAISPAISR